MPSPRRRQIADLIGLAALLLALLDCFRPGLMLLPTITAGGDTPCHYPTAVFLHDHLLPHGRLHGWYPGAYAGQPLLLYYFPLPFVLMSALATGLGMPVAFKLGTALGVFFLPLLVYAAFRLMGLRFPAPLLGAAAAFVFLFVEENPIWGGTIPSTLAGEFAYTYGIGLGVLFLGVAYRAHRRGASPWGPAATLALTALAHGYAVLWAGLSSTFLLFGSRRPIRTLAWLLGVAGLAFSFAAFFLLPLVSGWGWTTAYDDPWLEITPEKLVPRLIWPLLLCGVVGLVIDAILARRRGGADPRLRLLAFAALVGAGLAAAGPALGVIDVRFVPFAQLSATLLGAAVLGRALQWLVASDLAALGLVGLAIVYGEGQSTVVRSWIEWNYTGLEAKELWPAWKQLNQQLAGTVADPRVAVEYSQEHEKAGSIRMYETLPLLSGRSTLEGVYNQASLQTHAVYYLASELGASSPNPFRSRHYSTFDTERALHHLRLYDVREVVALSDKLVGSLASRSDVEEVAAIPPYHVFRLLDPGLGYVEPLEYQPVRSPLAGFRDKAYRWLARDPPSRAHLVFTDDPRFDLVERDEWLAPPERPLEPGVSVEETVEDERITIHTDRPGHPLLVKVSYHPRWRVEGADGPYLVSPAFMLVIPRQRTVRLVYQARDWSDWTGAALTGGVVLLLAFRQRRRTRAPAPQAAEEAVSPGWRLVGAAVPVGLLVLLGLARFLPEPGPTRDQTILELENRASKAYADKRYADAAEYVGHAVRLEPGPEVRPGLECLRGESLLRLGRPREAAASFEEAVGEAGSDVYAPQALSGLMRAWRAAGEPKRAEAARQRLLREYPHTPWAELSATPESQEAVAP